MSNNEFNRKILVGIDVGSTTTSLAFYDTKSKKYLDFHTGTPHQSKDYFKTILQARPQWEFRAVIEDPNLDTASFDSWRNIQATAIQYKMAKKSLEQLREVVRIQLKKAQDAGRNKQIAVEYIRWIHSYDIPVVGIAPSKRKRATWKYNDAKGNSHTGKLKGNELLMAKAPTKCDAKQFQTITGHDSKAVGLSTNEHKRDAGTLVFDMTFKGHQLFIQLGTSSPIFRGYNLTD